MPPALVVIIGGRWPKHSAQFIGQYDVEQGVEVLGAPFGSDFGHGSPSKALVGRTEGVADAVAAPTG